MLFSIVIPTYNRSLSLKACLTALIASGCRGDEILVMDDNSRHDIAEKNKALCANLDIVYNYSSKNQGASATRNRGIELSKSEWIAFIDDDVCVEPDWRKNCEKILSNLSGDVIGVEGRVVAEGDGVWDKEVTNLSGKLYLSCNMIYKKHILDLAGRFDERFSSRYPSCEDHELAIRALFWGKIIFAPSLCVRHLPRKTNMFKYVISSFYRMQTHLYSELYFYLKHRDKYHTLRYAKTFWGTYKHIAVGHIYIELRRRRLKVLFSHPVQFAALFFSGILEQICAIFLFRKLLRFFIHSPSLFFEQNIDVNRTKKLWKINADIPMSIFVLMPMFWRSIFFPLIRKPVYSNSFFLKKIQKASLLTNLNFFLRIDDVFFNDMKSVNLMCDKLSAKNVHFCAAIIGNDMKSPNAETVIRKILSINGQIALHGFSHFGKFGPFNSELLQMNFFELDAKINEVCSCIPENLKPKIFIPPFNAINREQIVHLSKSFKVICGGPETARFTDCHTGPVALCNESWYFPTFQPFYGCASNILKTKKFKIVMRQKGIVCIDVHMPDEAKDNFITLMQLIDKISDNLTSWDCLFNDKPY